MNDLWENRKGLSAVLSDTSRTFGPVIKVEVEPVLTRRAADRVRKRWPDITPEFDDHEAEKIVAAMVDRLNRDDWDGCYWSDVRKCAWALWSGGLWLDQRYQALNEMLRAEIRPGVDKSGAYLKTIWRIYLQTWQRGSHLTSVLANSLKNAGAENLPEVKNLCSVSNIFDVVAAPGQLANKMAIQFDPYEYVRELGIASPHGAGFMQVVNQSFVTMLRERVEKDQPEAVRRLMDWLRVHTDRPMQEGAAIAVNALLEPWADKHTQMQQEIETSLIKSYGDPRLINTGVWGGASTKAHDVIHRWLTSRTLEIFFDIIGKAQSNPMWPQRGEFWRRRLRAGSIQAAWVVLNDAGRQTLANFERNNPGLELGPGGRNISYGAGAKKCFLILKDSGLMIVEGTDNFSAYIIRDDVEAEFGPYPAEFRDKWATDLSRRYPDSVARIPHQSGWQRKVANQIEEWKPL